MHRISLLLLTLTLAGACSSPSEPSVGNDAGGEDVEVAQTDAAEQAADLGSAGDADLATPIEWPVDESGVHVITQTHDGIEREVRLAVPAGEVTGAVLLLHGAGQTAESFLMKRRAFVSLAHGEGWLVVAPLATIRGQKTSWNYSLEPDSTRDTDFLLGLLDQLDAQAIPGPRYVAGFSNGGRMTHSLLAQRPERFSAGGIVASNLGVSDVPDGPDRLVPDATGPMPVWMANGSGDSSVPFNGGTSEAGTAKSVQDAIDFWTTASGCTGMPTRDEFAGGFRESWTECTDAGEVVQVAYQSREHAWPERGDVPEWDGNPELRDFFLRHAR